MRLEDRLTMVISSCEAYSDLWDNHITLLHENWKERLIKAVIVTDKEHKNIYSDIDIFSAGDNLEMPQRLKKYVQECKTDYILVTLDDYYIDRPIDSKKIQRAIEIMEKNDLDYFRFWPFPHEKKKMDNVKDAFWINLEGNYKVNLYPAIWKKSFLEATFEKTLNSWEYEVTLTKIAKSLNAKCVYSTNDEFHIVDVIRKGKLLHPAKRFLDKKGLKLDREVISRKQEVKLDIMYYGKEIIPKPILRFVKKILIKTGHNFISEGI
ncbi:MAG: hypothetical protein V8R62_04350 [Faecalibacillus intestinalis]